MPTARNRESLRRRCGVIEQCGLADPWVTSEHECPTAPGVYLSRNSSSTAYWRLRPGSIEGGVRPGGSIVFIVEPTDAKTS